MAGDYIPHSDGEFLAWVQAWLAYAADHLAEIGLTAEDLAVIRAKTDALEAASGAHATARNAARSCRRASLATRGDLEASIRATTRRVQANPSTTDANRAGLGVTVRNAPPAPAVIQDSRPVPTVNAAQRLRHEIRWRDERSGKRARPAGIAGCEVWVKFGEPPADPSQLRYAGTRGRAEFVAEYPGEQAGQVAHYMLRWVNRRGQTGPWSETVSATIQN